MLASDRSGRADGAARRRSTTVTAAAACGGDVHVLVAGANAAAAAANGADPSTVNQGTTVFATLSYRLWAPEGPAEPALYHK